MLIVVKEVKKGPFSRGCEEKSFPHRRSACGKSSNIKALRG